MSCHSSAIDGGSSHRWAELEVRRPWAMRFRLLPSLLSARGQSGGWPQRRHGHRGEEDEKHATRIDLTPALELILPATSSNADGPSSGLRVYRLLSPTATQDVLSSASGSQPLVNLDALLLSCLGVSPLEALLRLRLSRFKGDLQLDLPFTTSHLGSSSKSASQDSIDSWRRGIWVSLRTARRAMKLLSPEEGGQQPSHHLHLLSSFLSWDARQAWSLDEGLTNSHFASTNTRPPSQQEEEESRISHNWIPTPTALHPSPASTLSTTSLLQMNIQGIKLLPRSNPTVTTFLSRRQRQDLLQEHVVGQSGNRDPSDPLEVTSRRSRCRQREIVRNRLRTWTVQLVEAVEVWREDWPEDAPAGVALNHRIVDHAQRRPLSQRPLVDSSISLGTRALHHEREEAIDWRERVLSQMLPILIALSKRTRNGSGDQAEEVGTMDDLPLKVREALPTNLPEELLYQLQVVEYLWTISEHIAIEQHDVAGALEPSPLSNNTRGTPVSIDDTAAEERREETSAASSTTAINPPHTSPPPVAKGGKRNPSLQQGEAHTHRHPVEHPQLTTPEGIRNDLLHTGPDPYFFIRLSLFGRWVRFALVIGPGPDPDSKGGADHAGGGGGGGGDWTDERRSRVSERYKYKKFSRERGGQAQGWLNQRRCGWGWTSTCFFSLVFIAVGLGLVGKVFESIGQM